jgi:hypothetical protein
VTAYAANESARRFYGHHGFTVRSVVMDRDDLPSGERPPETDATS